jgi:hypothetical protein
VERSGTNMLYFKSKLLVRAKARWEKLKQFSIKPTKPISINSVSNSANKIHFHCHTVQTIINEKAVRIQLKLSKKTLEKKAELFYSEFFSGLFKLIIHGQIVLVILTPM